MKFNSSSYFPLRSIDRRAPNGILFGPTTVPAERDCVYPDRVLKLNSTVIWIPAAHKSVGIASYVDAQANNDAEALAKITALGIPLGVDFGVGTDLTGTYEVRPRRAKR